jgi:hypothetical protein
MKPSLSDEAYHEEFRGTNTVSSLLQYIKNHCDIADLPTFRDDKTVKNLKSIFPCYM